MDTPTELRALVPDAEIDACRRELHRRLHADELELRPAPPGRYAVHDDRLYDDATAARRGGAMAAAVGGIVGGAIAMLVVGVDAAPWPLFVAGGALFASGVGAIVGLQRHEVLDDDPATTLEVGDGWWLVEVRSGHHTMTAHRIVARHRGVLLESTVPAGA
jgi:hypothetical protein